jgi:hypothetical protein
MRTWYFLSLLLITASLAVADDSRESKPTGKGANKPVPKASPAKQPFSAKPFTMTPEREATVTEFVEQNHAELAQLLAHLKTNQPKEYERAVRDLFRVTEKLALVRERDSRQYDLELRVWQAQSRAQLLVARMKMTDPASADNEELRKQLREILAEQWQARLEVLQLDRDRATARLNKLAAEIERIENQRDAIIDSQLRSLTNAGNSNAKAKARADREKSAADKPQKSKDSPGSEKISEKNSRSDKTAPAPPSAPKKSKSDR